MHSSTDYVMLGSNTVIKNINLQIDQGLPDGSEGELCLVRGNIANDFMDDSISFRIIVSKDKFEYLSNLIKTDAVSEMSFSVDGASGLYSPFSPDHSTNRVKVLTNISHAKAVGLIAKDKKEKDFNALGISHLRTVSAFWFDMHKGVKLNKLDSVSDFEKGIKREIENETKTLTFIRKCQNWVEENWLVVLLVVFLIFWLPFVNFIG